MDKTTGLLDYFNQPAIGMELLSAYDYLEGRNAKTPIVHYGVIERDGVAVDIWVKLDTFNNGGSFKDRGSAWAVYQLFQRNKVHHGDTVVTASAGNHAKGVARAAKENCLEALIFMAESTPQTKIEGTRALGAEIKLVPGDYSDAAREAQGFAADHQVVYIPAYQDPDIIVGQSTVLTETITQLYNLGSIPDFFVSPFGGGGLANGCGIAAQHLISSAAKKNIRVYGVQAENYSTMVQSFHAGRIVSYSSKGDTIADGIKVPHASQEMLRLSLNYLDGMASVTEEQIKEAILTFYHHQELRTIQALPPAEVLEKYRRWGFSKEHVGNGKIQRMNILEGASAAALAAVLADDKVPYAQLAARENTDRLVGVVVASGNNIDQAVLQGLIR